MAMFKVTAHVFNTSADTAKVGTMTFVSHDHELASKVAGQPFEVLSEDMQAHVDFEAYVRIGRRSIWVDCNPRSLDMASAELMELASAIRGMRKPRVA